jgi:hypothetical protein
LLLEDPRGPLYSHELSAISFSRRSIRLWQHFDAGTNHHRRSRGFITLS